MAKEKFHHKITNKHLKVVFGIILILCSIYGLINYTFASTAAVYSMVFLFGNFYFIPFALVIYWGITLIFKPLFKKVSKKVFVILGTVFLILALLMSLCYIIEIPTLTGEVLTYKDINFSNFIDVFGQQVDGLYNFNQPIPVFNPNFGGGFFGYFLIASFNTIFTTHIGTVCICALLFLLALAFYLYFPIRSLVFYVKKETDDQKIKQFKKTKKDKIVESEEDDKDSSLDQEEEDDDVIETEYEQEITEFIMQKRIEKLTEVIANKTEQKTKITIHTDDSGFSKPSFSLFGEFDEIIQEEKPANTIEIVPVQKPEIKVSVEPKFNEFESDFVEEVVEENPIVSETITPSYENNNYYENEEVIDDSIIEENNNFESENPENEQIDEENYDFDGETENIKVDDNTIGFVSEETLKQSNQFEKEEIYTPEPPIKRNEISFEERLEQNITVSPTEEHSFDPNLVLSAPDKRKRYIAPSVNLLKDIEPDQEAIEENKRLNDERLNTINEIFEQLKVGAKATAYTVGPSVTRFDIFPNRDVSVSLIEKYVNDLCIRLGGVGARFEKIVQGKTSSALEIPNQRSLMVGYKDCFVSLPKKKPGAADLYVPFGKSIDGTNVGANLAKFPHLLVSGTTGSGKSVYINTLILTLIMRNSPEELKLLLIDPKEVEFKKFNDIPHLLGPVVTTFTNAKIALDRLAEEMNNRYSLLNEFDYSDIKDYNEEAEEKGLPKMPYIVCIIDEYADLIENDKTISSPVTKISAKARACGIHLVIATQRPSTNVITGTIKSNIAVRVAFMASSGIDSRVMLDQNGAETLVGNGDMLVQCQMLSRNNLVRAQGFFLSSLELKNILNFIKQNNEPEYHQNFLNYSLIEDYPTRGDAPSYLDQNEEDSLYPEVREFVYTLEYCSVSKIQNTFRVGFNRASKLFNQLVKDKIVSAEDGIPSRGKEVLIHSEEEFNDLVFEKKFN